MSMSYARTLIPSDPGVVPNPNQVRDLIRSLRELDAAPINPTLQVIFDVERIAVIDRKPLAVPIAPGGRGAVTKSLPRREGRNPATGEILIIPRCDCTLPADTEALPSVLD